MKKAVKKKVKNMLIEIDKNEEILMINGKKISFSKTKQGYGVAYSHSKTLLGATKKFINTQK